MSFWCLAKAPRGPVGCDPDIFRVFHARESSFEPLGPVAYECILSVEIIECEERMVVGVFGAGVGCFLSAARMHAHTPPHARCCSARTAAGARQTPTHNRGIYTCGQGSARPSQKHDTPAIRRAYTENKVESYRGGGGWRGRCEGGSREEVKMRERGDSLPLVLLAHDGKELGTAAACCCCECRDKDTETKTMWRLWVLKKETNVKRSLAAPRFGGDGKGGAYA